MQVVSIVLDKNSASYIGSLGKFDDAIVVVSPGEELGELFESILDRQIRLKQDATAEAAAAEKYLTDLCDDPSFVAETKSTVGRLLRYLVESMPFRFSDNSLRDYILAEASMLCARLVAVKIGSDACLDGRNLMICDDGDSFIIDWDEATATIRRAGLRGRTVVSGGYGRTRSGYSVSLGRGGYELTVTSVASALDCKKVVFYTESDGIQGIPRLSYDEAAHMLSGDDSPIFPPAMWPAIKAGIPIEVKDIASPSSAGTLISSEVAPGGEGITGIVCDSGLCLITVYGSGLLGSVGMSSTLFSALASADINIRFISQSSAEYSISFAVKDSDEKKAVEAIKAMINKRQMLSFKDILLLGKEVCIVSVCGGRMRNVPGISGKVYTALGDAGISIIAASQGGEELSISIVVDASQKDAAVAALKPLVN